MEKAKLLNFISKYSLNGLCNTTKWVAKNRSLLTNFITIDNSTLGLVMCKGVNFPEGEYGIYNTKSLSKILSILQTEFEVNVGSGKESFEFKDDSLEAKFMLCNLEVIANPPQANDIPEPDFTIDVNSIFIDRFIKSFAAIEEATTFSFVTTNGVVSLIINYSANNSDRIIIPTDQKYKIDQPLPFNANVLKEIFIANKDCTSGSISVSSAGIMICNFEGEDIRSKYFIPMIEN